MDNIQTEPNVDEIGVKLKRYLDERGIKYTWLTNEIGVTRAWLTNIFAGSPLTKERREQIEQILNIQLDEL